MKRTSFILLLLFTLSLTFILVAITAAPSRTQQLFHWNLIGTVLVDNDNPIAMLKNIKSGSQKWVRIGDVIDGFRVAHITRDRVEVSDGGLDLILVPGYQRGSVSTSKDRRDLNAILSEEFELSWQNPTPLPEEERRNLVKELTGIFNNGEIVPVSARLTTEGGEESISTMKTTTDIKSAGIQREDIIIQINGITPNSRERWTDIFDALNRASLISFSYVREGEIYTSFWKIH